MTTSSKMSRRVPSTERVRDDIRADRARSSAFCASMHDYVCVCVCLTIQSITCGLTYEGDVENRERTLRALHALTGEVVAELLDVRGYLPRF
jgi:hypothetical protein